MGSVVLRFCIVVACVDSFVVVLFCCVIKCGYCVCNNCVEDGKCDVIGVNVSRNYPVGLTHSQLCVCISIGLSVL